MYFFKKVKELQLVAWLIGKFFSTVTVILVKVTMPVSFSDKF